MAGKRQSNSARTVTTSEYALSSHSLNRLHLAGLDGLHQLGMVAFGLVAIGFGPGGEGLVECWRLSTVAGDGCGVANAGVSTRQQSGTGPRVEVEWLTDEHLHGKRCFHVLHLAHEKRKPIDGG